MPGGLISINIQTPAEMAKSSAAFSFLIKKERLSIRKAIQVKTLASVRLTILIFQRRISANFICVGQKSGFSPVQEWEFLRDFWGFMACSMGAIMLQAVMSRMEDECLEKPCVPVKISAQMRRCNLKLSSCGRISSRTRERLTIAFALDKGGIPENGSQDNLDGDETGLGRTRLGRIVRAGGMQLLEKLNAARRNFPMKIFLLLLGFYTANALATILGQTGDWDVLVAGVVVAAIEGIGMLMYRKPMSKSNGRLRNLVGMSGSKPGDRGSKEMLDDMKRRWQVKMLVGL
ncbi:hypothetical protein ACLOJK_010423 [Asimina triloba]